MPSAQCLAAALGRGGGGDDCHQPALCVQGGIMCKVNRTQSSAFEDAPRREGVELP